MNTGLSRKPIRGLILLLAIIGLLLRVFGIWNTHRTSILGMPLTDDSYYYFSLGRNIATTGEIRVDAVHATTGFQPLWGFFCAIPYMVFGEDSPFAVPAIQLVGGLLGISTGFLLLLLTHRLSSSVSASLIVFTAWLFSPQVIKHNLNGMETSLASFTLVILFYLFANRREFFRTNRRYFFLGAACGLAILSRVDAILMIVALALTALRGLRDRGQNAVSFIQQNRGRAIAVCAGAMLIVLPWLILVTAMNKPIVPESGAAVRALTLLHRGFMSADFFQAVVHEPTKVAHHAMDNVFHFTSAWSRQIPLLFPIAFPLFAFFPDLEAERLLSVFSVMSLGLITFMICRRSKGNAHKPILAFWTYLSLMTISYSLVQGGTWFFDRYATTIAAFGTVLSVGGLVGYSQTIVSRGRRYLIVSPLVVSAACMIALLSTPGYRWFVTIPPQVPEDGMYQAAAWIAQGTQPSDRVGAFQSGIIGYTLKNRVINLDGKVNSDALIAIREKKLWTYIQEQRIKYIVDWDSEIKTMLGREIELSAVGEIIWDFRPDDVHRVLVYSVRSINENSRTAASLLSQ